MNEMIIIDCIIAAIVLLFAVFALNEPKHSSRKDEMKAAVIYLFICALIVMPLLIYKCLK